MRSLNSFVRPLTVAAVGLTVSLGASAYDQRNAQTFDQYQQEQYLGLQQKACEKPLRPGTCATVTEEDLGTTIETETDVCETTVITVTETRKWDVTDMWVEGQEKSQEILAEIVKTCEGSTGAREWKHIESKNAQGEQLVMSTAHKQGEQLHSTLFREVRDHLNRKYIVETRVSKRKIKKEWQEPGQRIRIEGSNCATQKAKRVEKVEKRHK